MPVSRRSAGLAIAAAIALPAVSRAQEGISPGQILIGQTISLQGGKNDYAAAVLAGIQAYFQSANQRGGVHGHTIVLKTLDDDAKPALAQANARQLVTQDKVFLLFGSIEGGPSTAVMTVAVEDQVPFFGPMAGSPGFRRPHQRMVFPVRAEHREEFRALLDYAKKTGATRPAFVRSDSETGVQHLENFKRLCSELGMQPPLDLPFKSDITDEQIAKMAAQIGAANIQVVINHGSSGMYERLIRQARATGVHAMFSAVNSGSSQMAHHLGELARGMVFSQVVPSPWEGKSAITREYQQVFAREKPGQEFSYGSLEGFLTAKALVAALRLPANRLTRESFVAALEASPGLELSDRLRAVYKPGDHTGLTAVDLAIVTNDLKFRH
ncbi:ABC transporter substrate-binding protein [Caenimonas koreensis]|uniref:ABC transporter substrate-binding protein n=1 Tax=Caenimonas koreensis TaxID=367474 RepID=UPI003784E6E6